MDDVMAEIRMFAGNFAPRNWTFCRGQILSIAEDSALFALIGTIYGGDGQTTFKLPDFQGRVAVGAGSSVDIGEVGGTQSVTLLNYNLPVHTHLASGTLYANENGVDTDSPNDSFLGAPSSQIYNTTNSSGVNINGVAINLSLTGNNLPVEIMQPYLGMNFIICKYGIFPSRN